MTTEEIETLNNQLIQEMKNSGNIYSVSFGGGGGGGRSTDATGSVAIGYNSYPEKTFVSLEEAYIQLFDSLCNKYPNKKAEWEALLKMNGEYRQTILQIEESRSYLENSKDNK